MTPGSGQSLPTGRRCWRLRGLGATGAAIASILVLGLAAAPANASFELVGEFQGNGNTALKGSEGAGAAVNDTSGDLYIADAHNHRVERFASSGTFLGAWGWGVTTGASEYQVCEVESECQENGLSGEEAGEFVEPQGIAVDQETGDVYVLDAGRSTGVVQKFSAAGVLIASFGARGSGAAEDIQHSAGDRNDIAVGKEGLVYVTDEGTAHGPRVMVFNSSGVYQTGHDIGIGTVTNPGPVGVDALGDVFTIDKGCVVDRFEPAGALAWHSEAACEKQSLAVDPVTGGSFFYSKSGNQLVELNASGAVTGRFSGAPGEEATFGLAFNPNAVFSPGRPPGVLYAVNFNENREIDEVLEFSEPILVAPAVDSEFVGEVGETSAVVQAQINPNGSDTHYRVQYGPLGPCSVPASKCAEAPASGEADLGSAQADGAASVTLAGLTPGAVYHYRILAANAAGTTAGLDQTFTTYRATPVGLPDGRAYELVSPPEKAGGEVFPPEPNGGSCVSVECKPGINEPPFPRQASPDGNQIVYEGFPFSATGEAVGANQYLATRTPAGWETKDLSLPEEKTNEKQGFKAFSPDLSVGVLFNSGLALSPEAPTGPAPAHTPYANLYLQEAADPTSLRPLVTIRPPNRPPGVVQGSSFKIFFAGASSDFRHVLLEANDALTGNAVDGGATETQTSHPAKPNLYEWSGGELSLVNVLTGGTTTGPGAVFGSGEELTAGTGGQDFSHAISEDGSRIFWTDKNTGHVYVRENDATTTLIPDPGKFLTASTTAPRCFSATATSTTSRPKR